MLRNRAKCCTAVKGGLDAELDITGCLSCLRTELNVALLYSMPDMQSFWLQAVYHGFGAVIQPEKLKSAAGKPLQKAIQHVLAEPSFKVMHTI